MAVYQLLCDPNRLVVTFCIYIFPYKPLSCDQTRLHRVISRNKWETAICISLCCCCLPPKWGLSAKTHLNSITSAWFRMIWLHASGQTRCRDSPPKPRRLGGPHGSSEAPSRSLKPMASPWLLAPMRIYSMWQTANCISYKSNHNTILILSELICLLTVTYYANWRSSRMKAPIIASTSP